MLRMKPPKDLYINFDRVRPTTAAVERLPSSPYGEHICKGLTKTGEHCRGQRMKLNIRNKIYKSDHCITHTDPKLLEAAGYRVQDRKGKRVTAPMRLKERVEDEIDRYLAPYEEALHAMRAVVVGNGASAEIQLVPDTQVRMKASEAILDRVYGKAKQATEITGNITQHATVEVPNDSKRQQDVAAILAESGALGPVLAVPSPVGSPQDN